MGGPAAQAQSMHPCAQARAAASQLSPRSLDKATSRALTCQFCWKMATESSACDCRASQAAAAPPPGNAAAASCTAASAGLMMLRIVRRGALRR